MIKIFQIYFREDQISHLEPNFTPYYNTSTDVSLREWPIVKSGPRLVEEDLKQNPNTVWGFVSWKWRQKTDLPGQIFIDHINNNPDNDTWFMEPNYTRPVYFNPWTQGDLCHQNISGIAQEVFKEMGWNVPNLKTLEIPFCWYNYYAGNNYFWQKYFIMMEKFIETAKSHLDLEKAVFKDSAQYGLDATLPYFIFLVERLYPTLITIDPTIRHCGLKYNHPAFIV